MMKIYNPYCIGGQKFRKKEKMLADIQGEGVL